MAEAGTGNAATLMKYVGGKSRIAKSIVSSINHSGFWWEPFCGGLSVSVELSKQKGPGIISDSCLPLISLYEAYGKGWRPPTAVTREIYDNARTLPDTDPLKAFCGFGCSYAGLWFSSYYGAKMCPPSRTHPKGMKQDPVAGAAKSLLRDITCIQAVGSHFTHADFFDSQPTDSIFDFIYCDPPYAGTQPYHAVDSFDHHKFWRYCLEWSKYCPVYVSELACPLLHYQVDVVWQQEYEKRLGAKGQENGRKTEKLFLLDRRGE